MLQDRIEQLDLRTSQQAHSLDHLTRERLQAERRACQVALENRLQRERHHTQHVVESYGEGLQGQIQGWLEDRLASYGHCLDHHHDDSALPPRHIFTDVHLGPDGGRLFRSRSDETLSVSDYSGKGRKRQFYESRKAAMEQIRGWKVPPTGGRDSSARQPRRERGRSTDDLDGRDVVQRSRERNNNNSGSGRDRNLGLAASTGNVVTMAEVHKAHGADRLPDGASPKYEGEDPTGYGASSGRQTPAQYGAVPKRSIHFYPSHSQQPGQSHSPHPHHLQAQSFQARSHGNLSSRPAANSNNPPGAPPSTQPSQYPAVAGSQPPRRGILRSKTEDGALHERAARSSSTHGLQPNLDERGPLGESSSGPNPGGRGGPSAMDPSATGRAGSAVPQSAASHHHHQHNPLYGTAQSVLLDTARTFNSTSQTNADVMTSDEQSRFPRPRTRSTDAVLDGVDGFSGGGGRFRSRSEERVLDCTEESVQQQSRGSPAAHVVGDQSGYVTDSGMRRSYMDHSSNRNYGPYRPVPQARHNSGYRSSDASARPEWEDKNAGRFVSPGDRGANNMTRPVSNDRAPNNVLGHYDNHRPVSRNSGYFTDSEVKRGAPGLNSQPTNAPPPYTAPNPQHRQQEQQAPRQPATRYRVLPPLPPHTVPVGSDKTYPHIPPKPTTQNSAGGTPSVHDRTRSQTPTARDNNSAPLSSNVAGAGRTGASGGDFSSRGQNTYDSSARRLSESGGGAATPPFQGYNYPAFPPRPSSAAHLQDKPPAGPALRQTESPRELWQSSRQLAKDKAAASHCSTTVLSSASPQLSSSSNNNISSNNNSSSNNNISSNNNAARTHSPYQTPQPNSGRNSVSKSESNLTGKDSDGNSSPREPQPVSSGHYSVSNGCLRHDSFSTYSPVQYNGNGGSKEDSTCSSNQDSGYSSRMAGGAGLQGKGYGGGGGGGRSAESTTPSSSFSTDRSVSLGTPSNASSPYMHTGGNSYGEYVLMGGGNSSSGADNQSPRGNSAYRGYPQSNGIGNVHSSQADYPHVGLRNGSDYHPPIGNAPAQQLHSSTTPGSQTGAAVGANIQKQVQGWYQQKLLEAAQRLRNSEQYGQAADNSYGSYSTIPIRYDPVHGSDV